MVESYVLISGDVRNIEMNSRLLPTASRSGRSPAAKFSNAKDPAQPVPRPMISSDALYPPWVVQLEPPQPGGMSPQQISTSDWSSPEIKASPQQDPQSRREAVPRGNQPASLPSAPDGQSAEYEEDLRRVIARQDSLIESQRLEAVRSSIKAGIMRQELDELRVRFRNDHQVRERNIC